MTVIDYRQAGVDIAAGNYAVERIKSSVERTFSPAVLNPLGGFGALYDLSEILKNYQKPVLVQSIDGVGTKMMLARSMQRYDTIGIDLVSATANDIAVLGAKPLTLLDYIANDRLQPDIIVSILDGMVKACLENEISLVGGEMAEMPGTYLSGEHDLVGVITGVVEKDRIIDGRTIQPGDAVLALASSGLHTNGCSLARHLCFKVAGLTVESELPTLSKPLGEVLLTPHINYVRPIQQLLQAEVPIRGMAHITGGGLLENIPRILPDGCGVRLHRDSWPQQPIFEVLRQLGNIDDTEMYRTFNMGVGLILVLPKEAISLTHSVLNADFPVYEVGEVISGEKKVSLI